MYVPWVGLSLLGLFLGLCFSVLSYLALVVGLASWADRRLKPDETHRIPTSDGWTLTLQRFLPPPGTASRDVPVVLGHGLMMNGTCWELSDRASMPRALAARGHDVWVAEYRGARSSTPPPGGGRDARFAYSLEDHAYSDLPAIHQGVLDLTGAERLSWVGHSMGGILAYMHAERFGCDRLHRVVTLGSPVLFGNLGGPLRIFVPGVLAVLRSRRVAHMRRNLACVLPLAFFAPFLVLLPAAVPGHLSIKEGLVLIRGAVEDVSCDLLRWFLEVNQRGGWLFEAGAAGMTAMTAPLLVIAGSADYLAPMASVQPAFDRAGATEKKFALFGGSFPPSAGPAFSHSDLVSSPAAMIHVAPVVADWLERDGD